MKPDYQKINRQRRRSCKVRTANIHVFWPRPRRNPALLRIHLTRYLPKPEWL